jgi:hypothetical protein
MASVAARGAATLSDEICRTILPMNMMMRSVIQILITAGAKRSQPGPRAEKDVSRLFILTWYGLVH